MNYNQHLRKQNVQNTLIKPKAFLTITEDI